MSTLTKEYLEHMKLRLSPKQYELFLLNLNRMEIQNQIRRQNLQNQMNRNAFNLSNNIRQMMMNQARTANSNVVEYSSNYYTPSINRENNEKNKNNNNNKLLDLDDLLNGSVNVQTPQISQIIKPGIIPNPQISNNKVESSTLKKRVKNDREIGVNNGENRDNRKNIVSTIGKKIMNNPAIAPVKNVIKMPIDLSTPVPVAASRKIKPIAANNISPNPPQQMPAILSSNELITLLEKPLPVPKQSTGSLPLPLPLQLDHHIPPTPPRNPEILATNEPLIEIPETSFGYVPDNQAGLPRDNQAGLPPDTKIILHATNTNKIPNVMNEWINIIQHIQRRDERAFIDLLTLF